MLQYLQLKLVLGAFQLPNLDGIRTYITDQGANAIIIITAVLAIVFLCMQKIGAFIGFIIFAGVVYFSVSSPEKLLGAVKGIWELLF